MLRIIFSLLLSLCGSLPLFGTTPAVRLLNSVRYSYALPSVIDQNEWKELQLDRLITQLDRTKTSFGRWGLAHLLQPIADRHEIMKRQEIISFLVENDDVLEHFQKQLLKVKKHESSLLAYWDTRDELNRKCDQFYYVIPGFKNYLNKSSVALNLGVATQMLDAGRNLLMTLCLGGLSEEFLGWTMIDQKDFNVKRGIENGLKQPLRQHSFELDKLKGREFDKYTTKDYFSIGTRGSFGDRYHMLLNGFSFDASSFGLPERFSTPAQSAVGFFGKGAAFFSAALPTVLYDYAWGVSLVSVARYITSMHTSLKGLTERVIDVTTCFDGMAHIISEMQLHTDLFGKYVSFNQDHEIGMDVIQELAKKQRAHKHLYRYSRGHVLAMHKEIKLVKNATVPVLQTIALLDAFCSIAQLYKEHAHKQNKFSFVTFIDAHEPFLSYQDAWLALLSDKQAISNDVYLGNDYAGKIIITGPNGGGKSTLLKTVGVAAVLAQSWGIVPASKAEQTIFFGIKTGLAPHEDLQQGLSTFMAEKKCMEQLDTFIKRTQKGRNALVLIDEPYKGTVDEESAKRIYNFGVNIASNPHTLLCIATHVKKPILLATDTHGIFANYHVEITEERPGVFNRLFKLKQGPATWWFENEGQRGRFVDWISTQL